MPSELRVDKVSSTTSPYDPVFSTTGGALSHRNVIINGAMQLSQRGTSASSVTSSQYLCDRWEYETLGEETVTLSQSTDSPSGFSNSFKVEITSADSDVIASDYAVVKQVIEAQNLQHLKYGSSGAETITLSFHVKSSVAGTYAVGLEHGETASYYSKTYSISSANTWEKKTVTFTGNTATAINNDNGAGLHVNFALTAGTSYTTGSNGAWGAITNWFANHAVNVIGTANATFFITGVQLELGTVATPFEHRSYAEELQRCMRYYTVLGSIIGTGYQNGNSQLIVPIANAGVKDPSNSGATSIGSVPFRTTPTISGTLGSASFANHSGNAEFTSNTLSTITVSGHGTLTLTTSSAFATNGANDNSSMTCYYNGKTINCDAEL